MTFTSHCLELDEVVENAKFKVPVAVEAGPSSMYTIHQEKNISLNARLEQRQYKNDSIQSKIIPILKLACFSPKSGNFKVGIIFD